MRVKHVVVAEDALQRAADDRGVQHLMQLGNTRQHVVAHVEFVGDVPLDLVVDLLMDLRCDTAIEHQHAIADESSNLLVVEFDAIGLHSVFLQRPAR